MFIINCRHQQKPNAKVKKNSLKYYAKRTSIFRESLDSWIS